MPLKWSDLPLTGDEVVHIRLQAGEVTPDEVVKLARGATALLSKLISRQSIVSIQQKFPAPEGQIDELDNDKSVRFFGMGARGGSPDGTIDSSKQFIEKRAALFDELHEAKTVEAKRAASTKLHDLYQRKGN